MNNLCLSSSKEAENYEMELKNCDNKTYGHDQKTDKKFRAERFSQNKVCKNCCQDWVKKKEEGLLPNGHVFEGKNG